jgi:hypothetical protein
MLATEEMLAGRFMLLFYQLSQLKCLAVIFGSVEILKSFRPSSKLGRIVQDMKFNKTKVRFRLLGEKCRWKPILLLVIDYSGCESYMNKLDSIKLGRARNNFRTPPHSYHSQRQLLHFSLPAFRILQAAAPDGCKARPAKKRG